MVPASYSDPVSKWGFDQFLRRRFASAPPSVPVVGLRYFNVHGPGESHKGRMTSVAWRFVRKWHGETRPATTPEDLV